MEKTLRYTTLKGLINKQSQFSLNTFLSGRFYHKKHGWSKFKITPEVKTEILNLFRSVIGDSADYINFGSQSFGIFDRLIITKRLTAQYIAGQDYSSELRYIKKLIKRGY